MEELKKVPPMEQRQLVTYINHFITSTVTFLNNFMTHCEAKMMKSEQRLQKISASLCILETKLNSVPELRELQSSQFQTSKPPSNQLKDNSHNAEVTDEHNKTEATDGLNKTKTTDSHGKTEDIIISEPAAVVDESPNEPIVDPTILKYRKMIQFGVPRGAVELKMVNEGLDPKLL
ncbi:WASH complex subunit CCDC53 homolog [Acyrthosiphon pisum]|uniref:ACYPI009135 protein n=1 Tax=Acyrthosiphon pisum TaxID=7029 RepID=C4WW73_ACYPI|nr:WASH complex subunit CCDC53 homolog [Acyrthosiphon pisum]BAH72143.1 ACYPI009135 [Acyrthosiphon pisum]|eukprot:NP_001156292.1 WASH complex subunit CCDC53 homolog [Acyrthosiphon pisum]